MKYALALRGISYFKNYGNKGQLPKRMDGSNEPYEINFTWSWPFCKTNIIDPLIAEGHSVDIFFNTYNSEKLEYFMNICNPVKSLIKDYNNNILPGDYRHINKINYDTFNLIKQYQCEKQIEYDLIIMSRFDLFPIAKLTNLFIPTDTLSIVEKRLDTFFFVGKPILNEITDLFKHNFMVHEFVKLLYNNYNIKTHIMFKNITKREDNHDNKYNIHPLACNTRNAFIPNTHWFRTNDMCRIKDFDNMHNPESWHKLLPYIYEQYWNPTIIFTHDIS